MTVRALVRALALLLPLSAAAADPLTFQPIASIYQDGKDVALRAPEGVACSGATVVVGDTGNKRLLLLALRDSGSVSVTREVKLPQLPQPVRVQIDAQGNLLALDGKSHRIVRVNAKGEFGGFVELKGVPPPVVEAFKIDATGNLYVLDVSNGQVLVAEPDGTVVRKVELPRGSLVMDVAVDVAGNVFAVDGATVSVLSAPKGATSFSPLGASLKDRMSFPGYVTVHEGKLVVVDQHGMGLVVLGTDGAYLGRQLALGWSEGFLYYPAQICFGDKGEAFIADRGNNRVQQFAVVR